MNQANFNEKIYSNNNDILLGILGELQQILNISHENNVIKRIGDIINKMNNIIKENKKNTELIINHIKNLESKIESKFDKLNINNNQELRLSDRRYIGQVINGLPEGNGVMYIDSGNIYKGEFKNGKYDGKGIYYFNEEPYKGDRYEGDFKNGQRNGKGIYFCNNGDRYDGDFKNDKMDGKGIYYYNNGDRYEGDWKNDKMDGKGIYCWNNGDREMGDWLNDENIGKHVKLYKNGKVQEMNY